MTYCATRGQLSIEGYYLSDRVVEYSAPDDDSFGRAVSFKQQAGCLFETRSDELVPRSS
jgi:hypothetical protein